MTRAVFIDRDGTLNHDVGYVSSPEGLIIYPWAFEAVRRINASGMKTIIITNQSGVARGLYSEETLGRIHERLIETLASAGARIDAVYYCPHHPEFGGEKYMRDCVCRKPRPGMLHAAAKDHDVDLASSYVIGDKACDVNLAAAVGARSVLVKTGYGRETISRPDLWPCEPASIADNLLDAVNLLLDMAEARR